MNVGIGSVLLILAWAGTPGTVEEAPGAPTEVPATAPTTDPEQAVIHLRALLSENRWRVALEQADRLGRAHPDDARVAAEIAATLFRAGRFEQAEALLEAQRDEPTARGFALEARLHEAAGRRGTAMLRMNEALLADPDDRDVLYWSSGIAPTRALAAARLERYLERSDGDDPDRIDAARSAMALYRALGDRPVWIASEPPTRVELPLEPLWNPASGRIQGYVVRVRLGDREKPLPLLLDTGSPGLYVLHRVARKAGFEPVGEQLSFGGGKDRKHRSQRVFFETLDIGGLRFTDVLSTVGRRELDPTGRYLGVIGISAFSGYRVVLDFTEERMILERGPAPAPAPAAPYWTVEGQLLVRASIGDDGAKGLFLLDTGATRTMVSRDWSERIGGSHVGAAVDLRGIGGAISGSRALDGVRVRFEKRTVGPTGLRSVDLGVRSKNGGVEIAGFLGLDLLRQGRVVIDTSERTVRVDGPTERAAPARR